MQLDGLENVIIRKRLDSGPVTGNRSDDLFDIDLRKFELKESEGISLGRSQAQLVIRYSQVVFVCAD